MRFVVGIGNPGKKYDGTRHNAGFRVIDALRAKIEAETKKRLVVSKEFQAETAQAAEDVLLIKPDTYVNRTGGTVSALLCAHASKPSDFLLVCDDVNLPLGKIRLRASGGPGGHHGLESAIEAFGSEDFPRLRIGVGPKGPPAEGGSALGGKDLTEYVLEPFGKEEEKEFVGAVDDAVTVCREWIEKGVQAATNRLSRMKSNQQESRKE